jgi:hypothetical protein
VWVCVCVLFYVGVKFFSLILSGEPLIDIVRKHSCQENISTWYTGSNKNI